MHLDFIEDMFSEELVIELAEYEGCECALLRHPDFDEPIEVMYFQDSYYKYLCRFSAWHEETSSREELCECIIAFADVEMAAVEFFRDGTACFGGAMDIELAENINYNDLLAQFGEGEDITDLTFSVRAWDDYCCYDGRFVKHATEGYTIFRVYKGKE